MNKALVAAAAFALAAASTTLIAQEAEKPPKIGVIDMGRISNESLLGKSYQAQLDKIRAEIEAEGNKKQVDLQKMDNDLKAAQEEYEKQANLLSEEAREKKRQDIVRKQRERQAFLEDGQAEIGRLRERAQGQAQALNSEFQIKVRPIIEAVAKEKGIDILFDSMAVITVNKGLDISPEVVVKADEAERATAKASPPAKPAATASPKPAPKP